MRELTAYGDSAHWVLWIVAGVLILVGVSVGGSSSWHGVLCFAVAGFLIVVGFVRRHLDRRAVRS